MHYAGAVWKMDGVRGETREYHEKQTRDPHIHTSSR